MPIPATDRFRARSVILPPALGSTLMATVALRVLHRREPDRPMACVARYAGLLRGLPYVTETVDDNAPNLYERMLADRDVLDLTGTLDNQPNRRATSVHLIELLCRRAGVRADQLKPECALTMVERAASQSQIDAYRRESGKPVVLFATRTSTANKEWPWSHWNDLIQRTKTKVCWVHAGGYVLDPALPDAIYATADPRQTVALAAVADGIVTLDTFLLHAAAVADYAARAPVVTVLGSTRPECVSYPHFENLYVEQLECQPCCRPYHRWDLAYDETGRVLTRPDGRPKKWVCPHVQCMGLVSVDCVEDAIRRRIPQKAQW
jgi:ADP-heptose:LPS heptosyltransferase